MADPKRQVSEVSGMGEEPEPVSPEDAVAGAPEDESGEVQEGTAGSDAPPREGRPGTEPRPDHD
jgi:hypothetical protein